MNNQQIERAASQAAGQWRPWSRDSEKIAELKHAFEEGYRKCLHDILQLNQEAQGLLESDPRIEYLSQLFSPPAENGSQDQAEPQNEWVPADTIDPEKAEPYPEDGDTPPPP